MNTQAHQTKHFALGLGATTLAAALCLGGVIPFARAAAGEAAQPPANASNQAAAPQPVPPAPVDDALMRFSQAGREAIANIRMARAELFDGHTNRAMQDMKSAQTALLTAKAEAPSFTSDTVVSVHGKVVGDAKEKMTADVIPVGGDIVVADHFVPTAKHRPFLAKASKQIAQGDKKGALETLRQGAIAVAYNRLWMPIGATEKNLDQAITLASAHKYYAANLALKAIEDGLSEDSVSMDQIAAPAAS